ncbi:MAG: type II toxin-antitoxin system VapB family antitoxin [Rectinema subterraneum]|jgi:Arc/MetJ family transcription regulator
MATNLAIDDKLLVEALKIGGFRTKKETVNAALAEFIKKRKTEEVIQLFSEVEYDDSYDYKKMRNR